eukprot:590131-Pyramimonas_sp.AAC.1
MGTSELESTTSAPIRALYSDALGATTRRLRATTRMLRALMRVRMLRATRVRMLRRFERRFEFPSDKRAY